SQQTGRLLLPEASRRAAKGLALQSRGTIGMAHLIQDSAKAARSSLNYPKTKMTMQMPLLSSPMDRLLSQEPVKQATSLHLRGITPSRIFRLPSSLQL